MIHGKIDVVIGIDQLYTKVSSAKTISHPIKGLVLLDSIFGWSLGGSTLKKEEPHVMPSPTEMHVFTSNLITEPTLINRSLDFKDSTEEAIQESMKLMFEQGLSAEDSERLITEDERFAEQQLQNNIQFKYGKYHIKPLFKEEFIPMKNNYNISFNRYKSLR